MRSFMRAQSKKIEIEKWCEGVRMQRDPGMEFVVNWILNHGEWFRRAWEKSLCCKCRLSGYCGYEVREHCVQFSECRNQDIFAKV